LEHPGVESSVAFPGLSPNGFTVSSNEGVVFVTLKHFDERQAPDMSADAIAGALWGQFMGIDEAFTVIFPPPPVIG
ncbi:efflux RND transporter permease subunit, partial [Oleiphilus sp. HI0043]|uniref:efflux RND transporter permease subunit n=6 Tax=Oleiphilus TaxID=141450 RepID=UPI000AF912D9